MKRILPLLFSAFLLAGCVEFTAANASSRASSPGLSTPQKVVVDDIPYFVAFNSTRARAALACPICFPDYQHYVAAGAAIEQATQCRIVNIMKLESGPWEAVLDCSEPPQAEHAKPVAAES